MFLTLLDQESLDVLLPPQASDLAISIARRGMDLGILLKVYRVAADATWEFVVNVADAIPEGGPDHADVLKLLWGRAGHWINAAIEQRPPRGREILLLAERPLAWYELRNASRSQQYRLMAAILELDEEDKGEGTLVMAGRAELEDGRIEIERFGALPIRLLNVRKE